MKCKSNPCHPLYYKSCSLIIFVSIKAMQDKITLEIVSINKSNVRVNHKHQIKTSLTVIFGGFIHHLEPCWNKMFSLRARQFIICSRCRLHRVCPSCACFFTPNFHLVITLLLGMNKILSTAVISSTKKAELPESKEQHFPGKTLRCKPLLQRVLLAAHRHTGDAADHVMPHYTPSSSSSLSSPHATMACVALPQYPLS